MIADPAVEKVSIDKIRFFRVERSYAVRSGKWYFEFEVVTGGDMRVGWARPGCRPDVELGADDQAFAFEGSRVSPESVHTSSAQGFSFSKHFSGSWKYWVSESLASKSVATTTG